MLDTAALTQPDLQGGTLAHLLVTSAIDSAGHLYAAFSLRPNAGTQTHMYLIHSPDHGVSWGAPVDVGSPLSSNVMPALAVGSSGVAYLSWYGSTATDFRDPTATWVEMFAESPQPLSTAPGFVIGQVDGNHVVHVGGIDTAGAIGSDTGAN